MRIAVFDYGVGNLHSLTHALRAGAEVVITPDPDVVLRADALVLPGVGAFGAAAERLAPAAPALRAAVDDGFPCLGICLGMQLLLDTSEEGPGQGLGVVPGRVLRLHARRVPHMGWNRVDPVPDAPDPLIGAGLEAYFANSYIAEPDDPAVVVATTEHDGIRFPAAVRRRRVWGVQFHPEKSGPAGLSLLAAFMAEVAR